jgi:hypothetical protein
MHEIGVAIPSWNKVNVHMVGKTRTSAPSKVYTDVKAVRRDRFGKNCFTITGKLYEFKEFFIGSIVKIRDVSYGSYKQMSVVIRKPVENYDGIFCSPEDEIFLVVIFVVKIIAYEAIMFFGKALDVFNPPWRP